jgi:hypothetical protein
MPFCEPEQDGFNFDQSRGRLFVALLLLAQLGYGFFIVVGAGNQRAELFLLPLFTVGTPLQVGEKAQATLPLANYLGHRHLVALVRDPSG